MAENSKVEEVSAFEYTYTPFDRSFPIRQCVMTVYARNKEEADELVLTYNYKFFEQDTRVSVKEYGGGYRRI